MLTERSEVVRDSLIVPLTGGGTLREPRMFAAAERFTVRCDHLGGPKPVAFKPVALHLDEVPVKASAWQIHDALVNGRPQLGGWLNGDLFSQRQFRVNRAIVSGFDTIAVGGAFELDISFQGANTVSHAPFRAALLGFEVDPGRGVTEYSGPVRLRGWDGELVSAAWDGPARVLPGERAWFVVRPKDAPFRPERLVIDCHWQDWMVEDLHVDDRPQFLHASHAAPLPGDLFHPGALDTFVKLDVVSVGRPLAVRVCYVGSDPCGGRFGAVVYGSASPE